MLIVSQGPDILSSAPDVWPTLTLNTELCFMTYFVVEAEEVINAGSEICRRYMAPVSLEITFRTRKTYS